MSLPALTPGHLRQLSPEGRLERHEAILAGVTGEIPEEDLATYRRYVEVARSNWQTIAARVYLERADAALLDLQHLRSKEVHAGRMEAEKRRGRMKEATDDRMSTEAILGEMQRLVDGGMSVRSASRTTAMKKIGTSAAANKRLWDRWSKKMATRP